MSSWTIPALLSTWITRLENLVERRLRDLVPLVFCGLLFTAERRRTCTSWFRTAGITNQFRRAYRVVCLTGRQAEPMGMSILFDIVQSPAVKGQDRIKLALDDTPSKRYGPHVEGAGVHHNPTPGPTNQPFVYGHNFVTLAFLAKHPDWGTIALPVRAELYVRQKDLPKIPPERRPAFRTKLTQAADLINWAGNLLKLQGKPIWLAVDGGYAKREVIRAAKGKGTTLVGRLRKDAALRSLPGPQPAGKRGRKPIYGTEKISLAKRAAHRQGWQTQEMDLYGKKVTKTFKTFLATWQPAGGVIRVVLVKESDTWLAFFCTDPEATPADILEMVSDRNSLEQTFKDVKEVWGAGQQQLTNLHANIGAWHMNLWAYTMLELWAWELPEADLVDRSRSPWDDQPRRPSHADRRKALLRSCLREQFQRAQADPNQLPKLLEFAERLMLLAA
jgi:DDE superfamily endonuclease